MAITGRMVENPHPLAYRFAVINAGSMYQITDNAAYLFCEVCRISNCEHIESAIEQNLDCNIVRFDEVTVSLLSSSAGVSLGLPLSRSKARPVNFAPHQGIRYEESYLGLISEGEGRRVIRLMIADWLSNKQLEGTVKCRSRTHGPAEEKEFLVMMEIGNPLVLWDLISTGSCQACNGAVRSYENKIFPVKTVETESEKYHVLPTLEERGREIVRHHTSDWSPLGGPSVFGLESWGSKRGM